MARPTSPAPGAAPPPKPRVSPLQVQTFDGVPQGMITAVPKNDIPDGGAFYLQDVLVDLPEITRRRGPLTGVTGMVSFTNPVFGAASCYDPQGTFKIGILESNGTNGWLSVLSSNYSSKTLLAWRTGFATAPYPIVGVSGRLTGGSLIGTSTQYDEASPTQSLAVWRGASKSTYNTGTVTTALNSTSVTGTTTAWLANASPGMFLVNGSGFFVGVVKSVNSDTSITLENAALQTMTGAAYSLVPLRGVSPWVTVGEITSSTASTTVTGANTKFSQQGLGSGTWSIFRASDWTYVGTVASVTNDTSLTLGSNAGVNMSVERYVAVKNVDITATATTSVGFLTATFANRQWYANLGQSKMSSTVWFSEENMPDCIDTSPNTGDFIPVSSGSAKSAMSPIKAIIPGFNSLLILKDDESFALLGSDPVNFEVRKVWDDGCLSGMSVQQWKSTVIYAGRNGIYSWDGTTVNDLTKDTLGKAYKTAVKTFDPTTYRMWSMIARDHYFLFIESVTPEIAITKGKTTSTPSVWTIAINLNTGAFTMQSNLDIRGTLVLPSASQTVTWFLVNTSSGGAVCDATALFDSSGNDSFTCIGNTVGPSFFMETKRYAMGDPLRRKMIKQVAMHYQSFGDGLTIDTIVGLGTVGTGTTNTTSFPQTAYSWQNLGDAYTSWTSLSNAYPNWNAINLVIWGKKRYKFLKHDNFLGFRIYQNSGSNSLVQLGPWQLGFKVQAPGRI